MSTYRPHYFQTITPYSHIAKNIATLDSYALLYCIAEHLYRIEGEDEESSAPRIQYVRTSRDSVSVRIGSKYISTSQYIRKYYPQYSGYYNTLEQKFLQARKYLDSLTGADTVMTQVSYVERLFGLNVKCYAATMWKCVCEEACTHVGYEVGALHGLYMTPPERRNDMLPIHLYLAVTDEDELDFYSVEGITIPSLTPSTYRYHFMYIPNTAYEATVSLQQRVSTNTLCYTPPPVLSYHNTFYTYLPGSDTTYFYPP